MNFINTGVILNLCLGRQVYIYQHLQYFFLYDVYE